MSNQRKHELLNSTLDNISESAPAELSVYHPDAENVDAQIHKYSRAQIHLFLRVRFCLLDFNVVESQITDGTGDGADLMHTTSMKKKRLSILYNQNTKLLHMVI